MGVKFEQLLGIVDQDFMAVFSIWHPPTEKVEKLEGARFVGK